MATRPIDPHLLNLLRAARSSVQDREVRAQSLRTIMSDVERQLADAQANERFVGGYLTAVYAVGDGDELDLEAGVIRSQDPEPSGLEQEPGGEPGAELAAA